MFISVVWINCTISALHYIMLSRYCNGSGLWKKIINLYHNGCIRGIEERLRWDMFRSVKHLQLRSETRVPLPPGWVCQERWVSTERTSILRGTKHLSHSFTHSESATWQDRKTKPSDIYPKPPLQEQSRSVRPTDTAEDSVYSAL